MWRSIESRKFTASLLICVQVVSLVSSVFAPEFIFASTPAQADDSPKVQAVPSQSCADICRDVLGEADFQTDQDHSGTKPKGLGLNGQAPTSDWGAADDTACSQLQIGTGPNTPSSECPEVSTIGVSIAPGVGFQEKCANAKAAARRCKAHGSVVETQCLSYKASDRNTDFQDAMFWIDVAVAGTCGVACAMGIAEGVKEEVVSGTETLTRVCEAAACAGSLAHILGEIIVRSTGGEAGGVINTIAAGAGVTGVAYMQFKDGGGNCGASDMKGSYYQPKPPSKDYYWYRLPTDPVVALAIAMGPAFNLGMIGALGLISSEARARVMDETCANLDANGDCQDGLTKTGNFVEEKIEGALEDKLKETIRAGAEKAAEKEAARVAAEQVGKQAAKKAAVSVGARVVGALNPVTGLYDVYQAADYAAEIVDDEHVRELNTQETNHILKTDAATFDEKNARDAKAAKLKAVQDSATQNRDKLAKGLVLPDAVAEKVRISDNYVRNCQGGLSGPGDTGGDCSQASAKLLDSVNAVAEVSKKTSEDRLAKAKLDGDAKKNLVTVDPNSVDSRFKAPDRINVDGLDPTNPGGPGPGPELPGAPSPEKATPPPRTVGAKNGEFGKEIDLGGGKWVSGKAVGENKGYSQKTVKAEDGTDHTVLMHDDGTGPKLVTDTTGAPLEAKSAGGGTIYERAPGLNADGVRAQLAADTAGGSPASPGGPEIPQPEGETVPPASGDTKKPDIAGNPPPTDPAAPPPPTAVDPYKDNKDSRAQRRNAACITAAVFGALAAIRALSKDDSKKANAASCTEIKRLASDSVLLNGDKAAVTGQVDAIAAGQFSAGRGSGGVGGANAAASRQTAARESREAEAVASGDFMARDANFSASTEGALMNRSQLRAAIPQDMPLKHLGQRFDASTPGQAVAQMATALGASSMANELAAITDHTYKNASSLADIFGLRSQGGGLGNSSSLYQSPSSSDRAWSKPTGMFAPQVPTQPWSATALQFRQPASGGPSPDDIWHANTNRNLFQIVSDKIERVSPRVINRY